MRRGPMSDRTKSVAQMTFLGALRIDIGNETITPEAERLFGMLVRLSAPLGRITSRQTMMDTLWPGADEANARHNLRQTVYRARELGLVVESGEDGLRLDPCHFTCDWDDPDGNVEGGWLIDYTPEFSSDLGSWVASQRVGVHAQLRPRVIRELQRTRSSGDLSAADGYAAQLLLIDEFSEEATLTRAEMLAMQGSKVDALRLLDRYLNEIGRLGTGRDAALPAHLLRRRIAEKLPVATYQNGEKHHGPLVGRLRESQRLLAGLFDARAGRGAAVLLKGREGVGKSRLLFEVKKSAVLQGMSVVEVASESLPSAMPFMALRRLVARLLDMPGAMGVSPDALRTVREWTVSGSIAQDDCPLAEIEDLLASVSEETPVVILLERCENIDAESLARLDRIYRRGHARYHAAILATSSRATPSDAPVELRGVESLLLGPMSLAETCAVIHAYAASEVVGATADQVTCAAMFAEGVPMYGIEMLSLMLDRASPDVIPWRVQIALESELRELTEIQLRLLALCEILGASARHEIVRQALGITTAELVNALDGLEASGSSKSESGVITVSSLLSSAACLRLQTSMTRVDSARAADAIFRESESFFEPRDFYSCLRLLIAAHEERRAERLLDTQIGTLVRRDTAQSILSELAQIRKTAIPPSLTALLDVIIAQVSGGCENKRTPMLDDRGRNRPSSLPFVSEALREFEYTLSTSEVLGASLCDSRDPTASPAKRLADSVMALVLAFNLNDPAAVASAYKALSAVRHSFGANPFDVYRGELIYHAYLGDRARSLEYAALLAAQSRIVNDVDLACTGLRNAAQAHLGFGDVAGAQQLLLESRELASHLRYHAQVVWADANLAELSIDSMDPDGAREYLSCLSTLMERHSLHTPLLIAELNLWRCWEALIRGEIATAQKAARVLVRAFSGMHAGTAQWTRLSVRLATYRGRRTAEESRDFGHLMASVGSRVFYPTEQFSLTAMLLFAREGDNFSNVCDFVRAQFPRMEATGRAIWPFLLAQLG